MRLLDRGNCLAIIQQTIFGHPLIFLRGERCSGQSHYGRTENNLLLVRAEKCSGQSRYGRYGSYATGLWDLGLSLTLTYFRSFTCRDCDCNSGCCSCNRCAGHHHHHHHRTRQKTKGVPCCLTTMLRPRLRRKFINRPLYLSPNNCIFVHVHLPGISFLACLYETSKSSVSDTVSSLVPRLPKEK